MGVKVWQTKTRQLFLERIVIIMMNTRGSILLFDGDCNLCDSLVRFIITHDRSKEIMFLPLDSVTGRSFLRKLGLPEDYLKSVVYIKENEYYIRSSAVLNILYDLGGGWRLFYGFVIIPEFIRDIFYNIIVRIRYRVFRKKISCLMTDNT
jgi:predicted DCC family thiol-disulfide oxidoreductase YuxK